MIRRAIVENLGDFKHRLQADRIALTHIVTHLRDFEKFPGCEMFTPVQTRIVGEIEKELIDFNAERLGDLLDRINKMIESEDI